jgi:GDP-4-dehydro-6-deoxy-D-mannose reductase
MKKNILITGYDGFVAKHLATFLKKKNFNIFVSHYKNIKKRDKKITFIKCNINSLEDIRKTLLISKPAQIYHLAAKSRPNFSFKNPIATMKTNLIGTMNLLEQCKLLKSKAKIIVACSSGQFGKLPLKKLPLTEKHLYNPEHIYGLSKTFTDQISYQYYKMFGLKIFRAIIFNTSGPGKKEDVFSDFLTQFSSQINGKKKKILLKTGDLNKFRDFLHVNDLVKALFIIATKGRVSDTYNVCSSKFFKVSSIIDLMKKHTNKTLQVVQDKKLIRKFDEKYIFGSNQKLRKLGWQPSNNFEKIFRDMLVFYQKK